MGVEERPVCLSAYVYLNVACSTIVVLSEPLNRMLPFKSNKELPKGLLITVGWRLETVSGSECRLAFRGAEVRSWAG